MPVPSGRPPADLSRRPGVVLLRLTAALLLAGSITAYGLAGPGTLAPAVTPAAADGAVSVRLVLLTVVDQRDGDSWVASDGVEYRVGLVNTPEVGECGGSESTAYTAAHLVDGFTVAPYSTDTHGRTVARVVLPDGRDLGVVLARNGMADDRYLDDFRHEAPGYAAELDVAFAEARTAGAGHHGGCWTTDGT
ncbi:hypothetical protein DVS28_a2936 [Euzebya pacifica]|uniref:TNase-like domain-containing protein n=1 Tax=Euzebya pacifica TaxID=1608957 RepID=A0A346XZG8_9ACTN|nr:thermonuclease family protein [Euzebya pacifica]AXV07615.1 hypothetical protein DVS28_a2936 [Euzebya pacifica]